MAAAAAPRTYADFTPPHSLQEETDKLALRVDLSAEGFRKEQIRVQIDNFGMLRISGERPLGADGSRWRRFSKDFQVPDTCDAATIRARLDKQGVLLITMPKLSAADAAPGANTGDAAAAAAGQDHEPAGHAHASAPHAHAAAAAKAEEEKGHTEEEEDARAAAMNRPGGQQDEQYQSSDDDDDAAAATAPAARRPPAYGFAKDNSRKILLAIFALMLALVAAGLFARYTMDDPSAVTPSSGNHIVSLSDS